MPLDHATLDYLKQHHPAWLLLRSNNAPLVASFLNRVFVEPNTRVISQADLAESLEDELYALRDTMGEDVFPKSARAYLDDWASPDRGWLRKFYPHDSDEPHFDLTPATEKAVAWLVSLEARTFVGTESRLLTLFELLRQMARESETEPEARIKELERRRDELDVQIQRVREGHLPMLDDTAIKDRFQQFMSTSRELLSDFREVEHNFRGLDRKVRERITLWEGGKGELLGDIMGERDAIADSDQGRSFRAFWDFLMSSERQEELSQLLELVLCLPAVTALSPDTRTRRVHYDWLEAGEHAQRTVALLSQQLRRFLDDQAWLENRRIMEILSGIEAKAMALREHPQAIKDLGEVIQIDRLTPSIELPMERPLHAPAFEPRIDDIALDNGDANLDAGALFSQNIVDKAALEHHIRRSLQERAQVTLRELCEARPIEQGLAELIAYLQLGSEAFETVVDEDNEDIITWMPSHGGVADYGNDALLRQARLPRVVFVR